MLYIFYAKTPFTLYTDHRLDRTSEQYLAKPFRGVQARISIHVPSSCLENLKN